MAPNHNKITGELCSIIEQHVLIDVNEERASLYQRKENYEFDAKISSKDRAITRFNELLATPGLNVNVSTSKNNSLIAHAFMYICLVEEDVRAKAQKMKPRRPYGGPPVSVRMRILSLIHYLRLI